VITERFSQGKNFGDLTFPLITWMPKAGIGSKQRQQNLTGQPMTARFLFPSTLPQLTPGIILSWYDTNTILRICLVCKLHSISIIEKGETDDQ
jgi:hypothetical protein